MAGITTPSGPARVHLYLASAGAGVEPGPAPGLLVLGHGAGGSLDAPDLVAARSAALRLGWAVVGVEQPYRVAGRRAPPAAKTLDAAWIAAVRAVEAATGNPLMTEVPPTLVLGGRSSGARVACRTALALGADAVLCLAFPWHPPGRADRTRSGEVAEVVAAGLPVLTVQGSRDPFGQPPGSVRSAPTVSAVSLEGADHSLKKSAGEVEAEVGRWLGRLAAGAA